jgi:hypothetical protein
MGTFQLVKEQTLADLSGIFKPRFIVWKQQGRVIFAGFVEFKRTALGQDDHVSPPYQQKIFAIQFAISQDDLAVSPKTGMKGEYHSS